MIFPLVFNEIIKNVSVPVELYIEIMFSGKRYSKAIRGHGLEKPAMVMNLGRRRGVALGTYIGKSLYSATGVRLTDRGEPPMLSVILAGGIGRRAEGAVVV